MHTHALWHAYIQTYIALNTLNCSIFESLIIAMDSCSPTEKVRTSHMWHNLQGLEQDQGPLKQHTVVNPSCKISWWEQTGRKPAVVVLRMHLGAYDSTIWHDVLFFVWYQRPVLRFCHEWWSVVAMKPVASGWIFIYCSSTVKNVCWRSLLPPWVGKYTWKSQSSFQQRKVRRSSCTTLPHDCCSIKPCTIKGSLVPRPFPALTFQPIYMTHGVVSSDYQLLMKSLHWKGLHR